MSNPTKKPNKEERKCSYCHDAGFVSIYNKDGDIVNTPCPRCTEDVISHIRNWEGQMFDG
tara:strand:- start:88 stop:267 length:180 start_codon:yes stop_codon:yes gene_type:complete